ncbi:MAG: hypothetical protein U0892_16875 [Pirellulales bacterium]
MGNATSLRIQNIRVAPSSRARPGRLLAIRTEIVNKGARVESAKVIARIQGIPNEEGGRRIEVPPGESRVVQMYVRISEKWRRDQRVSFQVALNRPDVEEPVALLTDEGLPVFDTFEQGIDPERIATAVFLDDEPAEYPEWAWPRTPPHASYEMVVASRVDRDLSRQLILLNKEIFPARAADLDAIDTMVIASDRILRDAAAMRTLSAWIADGGRIWIMLDKVPIDTVLPLLPDGFSCRLVDDCMLNEFVVETDFTSKMSLQDRSVSSERPLHFRRVASTGAGALHARVSHTIEGFPAAIWIPYGRGQILLTTLEATAWTEIRTEQRTQQPNLQSNYRLRPWAVPLSIDFYEPMRHQHPLASHDPDSQVVEYPMKHIGSPVLSRGFVLSGLAGFIAALCAAAYICSRSGRLLQFGWITPVFGLAVATPILIASTFVRQEIGSTTARLQTIETVPGGRTVHVHEWMATYLGRSDEGMLKGSTDVRYHRSSDGSPGEGSFSWMWNDIHDWEINSRAWPTWLWTAELSYDLPIDNLTVTGSVDEHGLHLQLPKQLSDGLEDAVMVYAPGDVAVVGNVSSGGVARIDGDTREASSSWLSGGVVNDEQLRRDQVYSRIKPDARGAAFPTFPALIGWTKLWGGGPKWTTERDEPGAALVFLPIKLTGPQPNQKLLVPHSLFRISSPTIDGQTTTAFLNETGKWLDESTSAVTVPIRLTLPTELIPFQAQELRFEFDVSAPQRHVRVMCRDLPDRPVLVELNSPLGAQRFKVVDESILQTMKDGTLELIVEIGERATQSNMGAGSDIGMWKIEQLRATAVGSVVLP